MFYKNLSGYLCYAITTKLEEGQTMGNINVNCRIKNLSRKIQVETLKEILEFGDRK